MAVHDNFSDSQGSRPGGMTERLRMDLNSLAEEEDSPKGQRKMMETWIILELCNRGSLQVKSYHRCSASTEFFSRSVHIVLISAAVSQQRIKMCAVHSLICTTSFCKTY